MKKIIVRYKVKVDKTAENESLVKDVYRQLAEHKIEGFHYCTFKLDDDVSFVHIAFADTEEANNAFLNLPAFKEFQKNIRDRCDGPPESSTVTIIGSHNFLNN